MNVIKNYKEKIAKICLITTLGISISSNTIAIDNSKIDKHIEQAINSYEFENVEDKTVLLSEYTYIPEVLGESLSSDNRFSLADIMELRVENQGITNECWAFSTIKSMETNIALNNKSNKLEDFSERHMDYATSKTFLDGTNEKGFKKEIGDGGLLIEALAYLTNGQGAVLESEMPFEDNARLIELDSINKQVDTVVNDYYTFPAINKNYTYDAEGNTLSVIYTKTDGTEYTNSELNSLRNIIKNHIINDGAIATMTASSYSKYYNGSSIFGSTAYNCNVTNIDRDHAFTIIGWDDNYSRDNFANGCKPSTDGAYIVLNSYGSSTFDNGFLYVSYEDYFIENEMYGIQSTTKLDYDNLYQTDFYGGIYEIGSQNTSTGYYGTVFTSNSAKREVIDSVGVTLSIYADVEIYINPNGSSMNMSDLIKVGESNRELNPGYHRIYINPTKINGNEFAIVVKQHSSSGTFFISVETAVNDTAYEIVTSENRSYLSFDCDEWTNLKDMQISGIDTAKTDVCIKAYADIVGDSNIELTSNKYKIENNYILNITHNTNIEEFKENIITNSNKIEITKDGEIISTGVIITGMVLKLDDDVQYTLIVRGDINEDGNLSLTDLSKLILHYNEMRGFELFGNPLKAADMSLDGRVSLIDISQMLVVYNSI